MMTEERQAAEHLFNSVTALFAIVEQLPGAQEHEALFQKARVQLGHASDVLTSKVAEADERLQKAAAELQDALKARSEAEPDVMDLGDPDRKDKLAAKAEALVKIIARD